MKETFVVSEKDMGELAHKIVQILSENETSKAKVILLDGDLGAGKTTFTKEIAAVLGVDKSDVNSPTFILKKEYRSQHPTFKKLIHIDAYRFNTPEEAKVLKLSDDLEDFSNIIAIEWPSKIKPPNADIHLLFNIIDDETRSIEMTHHE